MTCPGTLLLAQWADEGRPASPAIELHLASCPACTAKLESHERVAASLRGLTGRTPEAPGFLCQVNARIDQPPRARWQLVVATSLAAAVLVLAGARLLQPSEPEFSPRGGFSDAGVLLGVEFFTQNEPGGPSRPLVAGERVASSSGFIFAVRASRPAKLMLLGVDAKQNVHWFYPAFTDAGSDPESISVAGSQALPEAVAPEDAAAGPFVLIGLFSKTPLRVSQVEAMLRDGGIERFRVDRLQLELQ